MRIKAPSAKSHSPRRLPGSPPPESGGAQCASVLIIVLWIALGLVSITLYFANSMSSELRASDNRVSGLVAEQAIEGAARYLTYILSNFSTNGVMLDPADYLSQAVPVGDAHFWLIGRDTNSPVGPGQVFFGLVDEASKLNLNFASSNMLASLLQSMPQANPDLAGAILDWRDTNGGGASQTYYSMRSPAYQCKNAPFETVDELRLLQGADMDTLLGEDLNRNGVLDPNEADENHNGMVDPGVLEYLTVYSREPGTYSNGLPRVNISLVIGATGPLPALLQSAFSSSRADRILTRLGLLSPASSPATRPPGGVPRQAASSGGGATANAAANVPRAAFTSPLHFYLQSGMKLDEFAYIFNAIRMDDSTNAIEGRINVNTASAAVLACLPGMTSDLAQTLVNYRLTNPDKLTSIAWVADALGQNDSTALQTLAAGDYLTTQSYQFMADVAALGPHGRGYRRTRFIFDTIDGSPKIIYRQDLSHLGWALGKETRQTWLFAKNTQ